MKKLREMIAPDVLLFDILILVYARFFLYGIVSGGKPMLERIPPSFGFAVGFAMLLFLPFYFSRQLKRSGIGHPLVFNTIYFFVFAFLVYYINQLQDVLGGRKNGMPEMLLGILGGGFIGIVGWVNGALILDRDFDLSRIETFRSRFHVHHGTVLFMVLAWLVNGVSGLYRIGKAADGFFSFVFSGLFFLLWTILPVVLLVLLISRGLFQLNRYRAGHPGFSRVFELSVTFLLTAVAVILISVWLELVFLDIPDGNLPLTLLVLTACGYLPLRIAMEFRAPLTPLNLVTGVGSAVYLVMGILKLA